MCCLNQSFSSFLPLLWCPFKFSFLSFIFFLPFGLDVIFTLHHCRASRGSPCCTILFWQLRHPACAARTSRESNCARPTFRRPILRLTWSRCSELYVFNEWDIFVSISVQLESGRAANSFLVRSAGAVAQLFDISCHIKSPMFDNIQDVAFARWQATLGKDDCEGNISGMPLPRMGDHYFVTPPTGTGISPVWDFRAFGRFKGNSAATVLAAKVANLPAPDGTENVDWLQLKSISGDLATQVRCILSDSSHILFIPFLDISN
jgi:hypothetical protein